jgi:hypothetical protein
VTKLVINVTALVFMRMPRKSVPSTSETLSGPFFGRFPDGQALRRETELIEM